jgi:hypothetical protein
VALPDVPVVGPATSAVAQRIANFQAAAESDGVLDAVAEETGTPRDSLDAVTTVRSGTGNVLEVRFVGEDPDQARAVVVETSRQALLLQAETDRVFALADADANQGAYDSALETLQGLVRETGITQPTERLGQLQSQYANKEIELAAATEEGDTAKVDRLNAELSRIDAEFVEVQRVLQADTQLSSALGTLTAAEERLRQAEGRVAAAVNAEPSVGGVVPLSKLSAMIKQGAYAALFGAALAVGFVIIVELLRSGTGASRPSLPRPTRQRTRAGAF